MGAHNYTVPASASTLFSLINLTTILSAKGKNIVLPNFSSAAINPWNKAQWAITFGKMNCNNSTAHFVPLSTVPDLNGRASKYCVWIEWLEYKVESLSTRPWRSCSQGSKTNPNFQLMNKPSRISPHEVLQLWLINTVQHLLVKNNKREGRGEA